MSKIVGVSFTLWFLNLRTIFQYYPGLNKQIRVSSRISNSPFILSVDCDMYSNNSESVRDALCFFMDEVRGPEIAYVQFPQYFNNITANDLYGNSLRVIYEVRAHYQMNIWMILSTITTSSRTNHNITILISGEFPLVKLEFPGIDANGGPLYIGTGCFHRRDALCGKKFRKEAPVDWKKREDERIKGNADVLEETSKILASCSYEKNTQWGKEVHKNLPRRHTAIQIHANTYTYEFPYELD